MYAQLLCGWRIVVVYTAFIVKVRRIQIVFQSRFRHDLSAPTSPATVTAVEHSGAGEQHLSTIKPFICENYWAW